MITCPKCSKDNQDHYKFCLGCGAELPRDAAPKTFASGHAAARRPRGEGGVARGDRRRGDLASASPPAQPSARPAARRPTRPGRRPQGPAAAAHPARRRPRPAPAAAAGAAPPPPAAAPPVICPQCGHPNPPNNMFCASCGFSLGARRGRARAASRRRAGRAGAGRAASCSPRSAPTAARPARTRSRRAPSPSAATPAASSPATATSRRGTRRSARGGGKLFVQRRGLAQRRLQEARAATSPVELKPERHLPHRAGDHPLRAARRPRRRPPTASSASAPRARATSGASRSSSAATRRATPSPSRRAGIHLGRERGDVLFPEDGYVSGLHCRLAPQDGQALPDRPRQLERHLRPPHGRDRGRQRRRAAHGAAALPRRACDSRAGRA